MARRTHNMTLDTASPNGGREDGPLAGGIRRFALMAAALACTQCRAARFSDFVWNNDRGDPRYAAVVWEPFEAAESQRLVFSFRSPKIGRGAIYWSSTSKPSFGSPAIGYYYADRTNEWIRAEICPHWGGAGRIHSLMTMPPPGVVDELEIRDVRIENVPVQTIDADKTAAVLFENASDEIVYGSLVWHNQGVPGRKIIPFTTAADGATHTYWFDLKSKDIERHKDVGPGAWKGIVDYFNVECVTPGTNFPAAGVRFVSERPVLPPDLGIVSFNGDEAIPRAGRPLPLEIVLRNYGTAPAEDVRFAFPDLPEGLDVLDARELAPTGSVAACEGWDSCGSGRISEKYRLPNERLFRVTLSAPAAGEYPITLEVGCRGGELRRKTTRFKVLPSLGLPRADYVPEPERVSTGPYHIGVTMFPGWTYQSWNPVWSRAPWRKPVLGWYDESKPETVDWQIKYLAENGVEWAMLCWYWYNGKPGPNAWMEAFKRARYKACVKWCLQWGIYRNNRVTVAEVRQVAKYWCDNYFKTPEYFRIDGKPFVNIFTGFLMERHFGREVAKEMIAAIRDEVAKAGLPGIVISSQRNPGFHHLPSIERLGFEYTTVYKYIHDEERTGPDGFYDFRGVAERSLAHWRRVARESKLPFFPSLSTGYDARPWLGEVRSDSLTRNFSVADFRRICEDAKRFSDETGIRHLLVGPLDEWGEGSIGWPNHEHGFGVLNAIRDTFAEKSEEQRRRGWPVNVAPEDVGLKAPQMPYAAK